jgi:hypothetical protein
MTLRCSILLPAVFTTLVPLLRGAAGQTDRAIDQADAIVVAEVQSGHQSGFSATFVLSIVRTLKGSVLPGTTVNATWGSMLRAERDLKGGYGLWFLRQIGAGRWTLAPPNPQVPYEFAYYPMSKASVPESVAAGSRPSTSKDSVAAELAGALKLTTDHGLVYHLASGLLTITESDAAPELFGSLRANGNPELRFIGLAGMVSRGDISALVEMADGINLVRGLAARPLVASAISSRRNSDPRVIQALGKIAASPMAGLESSAAESLKNIHTRETLPFLAQLLESNDPKVREAGMTGLSRFVDNLPITTPERVPTGEALTQQGPAPYRTPETDKYSLSRRWLGSANENEYLQFWRSWWDRMKGQLAPGSR